MIRASNCCTVGGERGDGGGGAVVCGAVCKTKGNILHKAQAPLALLLTFISLRLLLGGEGARVVSPALSSTRYMWLWERHLCSLWWAKYREVCVCFACVQRGTTQFYMVTMEFIFILMMLQLRRVSVGWQLRGRFLLYFPSMPYVPSCSLGVLQSCWPTPVLTSRQWW